MEANMNHPDRAERLQALRKVMGEAPPAPRRPEYANNHIHTAYSFSPYSPAMAAFRAWESGLETAGIMDHDTVAGAEEFIEAADIIGMARTVGFECRCSMEGTPFEGMRINNPDQSSVVYVAMHGIPRRQLGAAEAFLSGCRAKRAIRNRAMVERLNAITAPCGVRLDYDRDVAALSMAAEGGSVTERHILYALTLRLMDAYGTGEGLAAQLTGPLGLTLSPGLSEKLRTGGDPWLSYHVLGLLKAGLVEAFYIDATEECPPLAEFIRLAERLGAVPAYPYLGDIRNSVTGDKKDQTFEDGFLDELAPWLARAGFQAITFMPSRNTPAQLSRIMSLCRKYGLFQISGEDINSPFQSFICPQLAEPAYHHLVKATWALIGHEAAAARALSAGMFSPETLSRTPSLDDRITEYARIGHETFAKEGAS